ncbi:unnamed protein product, partial [Adineta ricciae]
MATHHRRTQSSCNSSSRSVLPTINAASRSPADRKQGRATYSSLLDDIYQLQRCAKTLKRHVHNETHKEKLLLTIHQWKKQSEAQIKSKAKAAKVQIEQQITATQKSVDQSIDDLTKEVHTKLKSNTYTRNDLVRWRSSLDKNEKELKQISDIGINFVDLSSIQLVIDPKRKDPETSQEIRSDVHGQIPSIKPNEIELLTKYQCPCAVFCDDPCALSKVKGLFEELRKLRPMDKKGPMSGKCDHETTQMESFLTQTFQFRNIPGEYIVQGVKSFHIKSPPKEMNPKSTIFFPTKTKNSFAMSVQEILDWQRSYRVYADGTVPNMNKIFIRRALQGLTKSGEEAFAMKFVVRISQCPILMEFDARVIQRELQHDWPQRIKLVSVTGIDFAG